MWVWRFRQKQADGGYKKVAVQLGTLQELRTEAEAWRKAESHRIHADSETAADGQVSFGALCNRYIEDAMPSRHSTRKSYLTILNKHVMPQWETRSLVPSAAHVRAGMAIAFSLTVYS